MSESRRKLDVAVFCATVLDCHPVFFDTETTGTGYSDQVVEVAIIDEQGEVLVHTLIRPTCAISAGAARVHGIAEAEVAQAPDFAAVMESIAGAMRGRMVVGYNAPFDWRMLQQSAHAHSLLFVVEGVDLYDAMTLYAEYWGEWNEYHGNYRWQKLGDAARQQRIDLPADLHRARADAEVTRRLFIKMAGNGGAPEERKGGDGGILA